MTDDEKNSREEVAQLRVEVAQLKTEVSLQKWLDESLASADTKRAVWEPAMATATMTCPVLVTGEAGLGKTSLARAIHLRSERSQAPFVVFDAAVVPGERQHAELFGDDASGGSQESLLARADGGTLALTHVEHLHDSTQSRLLEFLHSGKVSGRRLDVRTVWLSDASLSLACRRGAFRKELLQAISPTTIRVPPLRERKEEIPLLAQRCLVRVARANGSPAAGFSQDALALLQAHEFSGNLPELEETVEHAALACRETIVQPAHLPDGVKNAEQIRRAPPADFAPAQLPYREAKERTIQRFEQSYFRTLLERTGGNVSEAARQAGLDRSNFRRALRRAGIRGHSAPASRSVRRQKSADEDESADAEESNPGLARPQDRYGPDQDNAALGGSSSP